MSTVCVCVYQGERKRKREEGEEEVMMQVKGLVKSLNWHFVSRGVGIKCVWMNWKSVTTAAATIAYLSKYPSLRGTISAGLFLKTAQYTWKGFLL